MSMIIFKTKIIMKIYGCFIRFLNFRKIINILKIEFDLILKNDIIKGYPYIIKLEPTNNCNLECKFCCATGNNDIKGYMDFYKFKLIIDKTYTTTWFYILNVYGEPTLNNNLVKMIDYIHSKGCGAYMASNFNYTDKTMIKKLVGKLDYLLLSLDALDEITYTKIRKKGNYRNLISNLEFIQLTKKKLKTKKPLIDIQFLLTDENRKQSKNFKKFASKFNPDNIRILRPYKNENFQIKKRCWWPWRSITFQWNGTAIPCSIIKHNTNMGNIFNDDFQKLVNNDHLIKCRRNIYGKSNDSLCSKCSVDQI
jgi:MoaA/NifB/PqqE/SkfB family radical SAM enzyme